MHSINGRIKSNKEVGSKTIENVFTCKDCGHKAANKKVFGESMVCSECGSTNLELNYVKH